MCLEGISRERLGWAEGWSGAMADQGGGGCHTEVEGRICSLSDGVQDVLDSCPSFCWIEILVIFKTKICFLV